MDTVGNSTVGNSTVGNSTVAQWVIATRCGEVLFVYSTRATKKLQQSVESRRPPTVQLPCCSPPRITTVWERDHMKFELTKQDCIHVDHHQLEPHTI